MKAGDLFHTEQQKRILAMDTLLRTPGGVTRRRICERLRQRGFKTSLRTFMRDMDYLRNDLKAPVGYDRNPDGSRDDVWFYRDSSWTLGSFRMTAGTLWALLVAKSVVERYAGMPVAEELNKAYNQLAESLNCVVSIKHNALVPVSFVEEKPEPIAPEVWNAVLTATLERKVLRIEYEKGWNEPSAHAEPRTIHPYHIVNLQGSWYLLGSADEVDASVRQYAVRRIRQAKMLARGFQVPATFDIKKILDHTFGRFIGNPADCVELKVRFAKRVAAFVKEQRFHPQQFCETMTDGSLMVSFPVPSSGPWPFHHVIGWVLSWGADAEVITPPAVRQGVAEACRRTLDKYALH